jgi:metal-responsive CopG/Arc/MetJ family transcriptional regulator
MNESMKARMSSRARKVAISLPEDLYEEGERERQELGMSRSEYIASLYRTHQEERKLQQKIERYSAAYAQTPASAEEDALTESSERVLAESS